MAETDKTKEASQANEPDERALKRSHDAHNVLEFINAIKDSVEKGFGLTILTGAGVSIAAGIPSSKQLKKYLRYVFEHENSCQDIGRDLTSSKQNTRAPNTFGQAEDADAPTADHFWPNYEHFLEQEQRESSKSVADTATTGGKKGSADLWDKVDYLQILPLIADKRKLPLQNVTDSFFSFLTANKKPTQAHILITQLMEILGSRLLLTTNFDTLQEDAFTQVGRPVQVFNVPSGAHLPSYTTVSEFPSIIKLHGGKVSIVAGNDCHDSPSLQDTHTMRSYFREGTSKIANHLLVLGFSGRDTRIQRLLEAYAGDSPEARIFWLCFDDNDLNYTAEIKRSMEKRSSKLRREGVKKNWFKACKYYDVSLFLLHLYQALSFCLPSMGLTNPSVGHLPIPPYPVFDNQVPEQPTNPQNPSNESAGQRAFKKFENARLDNSAIIKEPQNNTAFFLMHGKSPQTTGVVSLAASMFHELYYDAKAFWLDIHPAFGKTHPEHELDVCQIGILIRDVLAKRLHIANHHRDHLPNASARNLIQESLSRVVQKLQDPTYIFLNLRSAPAPLRITESTIQEICELVADSPHLKVIFLTDAVIAQEITTRSIKKISVNDDQTAPYSKAPWNMCRQQDYVSFCHGLILFRGSIHYSALTSRAFFDSSALRDRERSITAERFITRLVETNRLRIKRGGFLWLQKALRKDIGDRYKNGASDYSFKREVRLLRSIADWYEKVFMASDDCMALFECLHFRLKVFRNFRTQEIDAVLKERMQPAYLFCSLNQFLTLLRHGRSAILSHPDKYSSYKELTRLYADLKSSDWEKFPQIGFLMEEILGVQLDLARQVHNFDEAGMLVAAVQQLALTRETAKRIESETHEKPAPFRPGEPFISHLYETACLKIVNRQYLEAERNLREVLKKLNGETADEDEQAGSSDAQLQSPIEETGADAQDEHDNDLLHHELEHLISGIGRWLPRMAEAPVAPKVSQPDLRLALKCMRRFLQLQLHKLHIHFAFVEFPDITPSQFEASEIVALCENVYAKSRELRRYIVTRGTSGFLMREAGRMRIIMAQILSIAGRRFEARRRLNEATANLRLCGHDHEVGWLAELEFARANASLNHCLNMLSQEGAFGEGEFVRALNQSIDALMIGNSLAAHGRTSIFWRAWAIELQLRAVYYGERYRMRPRCKQGLRSACFRRLSAASTVDGLLKEGMALSENDPFRRARFLCLGYVIHHTFCKNVLHEETEVFLGLNVDQLSNPKEQWCDYVALVQGFLRQELEKKTC